MVEPLERRRLLATGMLRDLAPGALHANPTELTVAGDHLYFVASAHPANGNVTGSFWELWRTDGTSAGTERLTHIEGTEVGDDVVWDNEEPSVANGPRGLVAVGNDIWFYDVGRSSSQVLTVKINRVRPSGSTASWDLGTINLSLGQAPRDLRNVGGQVYFYRDGDEFSLDPALKEGAWWTINASGNLVSTGEENVNAFAGRGPVFADSALRREKRFFVHDDGTNGRELWFADNPTLSAGILRAFGSDHDDDILISRRANKPSYLDVRINGFLTTLPFSGIRRIQIDLGRGDDRALVREDTGGGAIAVPVSIVGGAGNDTLQGASARDTIYGGAGDDALYGAGERDHLFGEAGNDRLVGGPAGDILWGGTGRDTFVRATRVERRDHRDNEDFLA